MVITLDSTHGHGRLQSMTKPTTPWRPRVAMPTRISSNDWRGRRARVLQRDALTCRDCGTITFGQEAHVDLILPVCEGAAEIDDGYYGVFCGPCYADRKRRERERWRSSSKGSSP
jgi:hypothetical protein